MIVLIVRNPMEPRSWDRVETDDAAATIRAEFTQWPSAARIYDLEGIGDLDRVGALFQGTSLDSRDITPSSVAGIERLKRARGPIMVTVPPADPLTAAIAVAATLLAVAVGILLIPKIPTPDNTQSSNKALSDRQNKPRPGARIPDIFGTVRSVPDMLAAPYRRFEDGLELEIGLMCVGRGAYDLEDVRDGDTLLASVAGAAAAFYGPGTSPNSGDAPQLQIGAPIDYPVLTIVPASSVNGQLLKPTNVDNIIGDDNIRFVAPDLIETNDTDIDFTDYFSATDDLKVSNANFGSGGSAGSTVLQVSARFEDGGIIRFETFDPSTVFSAGQYVTVSNAGWVDDQIAGTVYVDLSGTFPIDAVGPNTVTLSDPEDINTDWGRLADLDNDRTGYRSAIFSVPTPTTSLDLAGVYPIAVVAPQSITLSNPELINAAWANVPGLDGGATAYGSPSLSVDSAGWTDAIVIDLDDLDRVISNYVGLAGLYRVSKKGKQKAETVGVELELTPVNTSDDPIGPAELFPGTLTGSKDDKDQVGITIEAQPTFTGRCSMRTRRTTPTDLDYDGTIVDDVKWRDAYGAAQVSMSDFGNVTTVLAKTYATSGATSVKERKLNLRARRRLPQRVAGSTFTDTLVGTDDLADILSAVSLDPFIGGRSAGEVDFDGFYTTSNAIADYFGSDLARNFAFTFDDDNTSFEETMQTICAACFCQPYRQGSKIKITFERATEDSSLLFNHRNIIPSTSKSTVRLGVLDDQDGVELEYQVAKDGAKLTIAIPVDGTATSPRRVDLPGIPTWQLGYWQAWRSWNRMQYQNIGRELEATQEAALVLPQERVLIADLTRPDYLSGDVEEQDGAVLTLDHEIDLDPDLDYQIFLQLSDATTQSLPVSAWLDGDGEASDPRKVQLAMLPRLPLITDPEESVRSTYTIASSADVQSRAFLISEREPQTDFTESVRAVNYSFLYYQNDQMLLWLPIFDSLIDESAWQLGLAVTAGVLVDDAARAKPVYSGPGAGSMVAIANLPSSTSYTKSAWIKGGSGGILGSANEAFSISSGALSLSHGAGAITAALNAAAWHHVAATFDEEDQSAKLLIDGDVVASGTLPARASAALSAFVNFGGLADDLRLYSRALSRDEIREVYLASRIPS